jgi:hypothetical protein
MRRHREILALVFVMVWVAEGILCQHCPKTAVNAQVYNGRVIPLESDWEPGLALWDARPAGARAGVREKGDPARIGGGGGAPRGWVKYIIGPLLHTKS